MGKPTGISALDDKELVKPRRVISLGGHRHPVVMLAAGVRHMLAVTQEGLCYSWGDGSLGRLIGAEVRTYLLEKVRLVPQAAAELN